MINVARLKSYSRLASQIREHIKQKHSAINNHEKELSLDRIAYGARNSQKWFCYSFEDCLSQREVGCAAGAFTKKDSLIFYLLIHLIDNSVFEVFSYRDSPSIVQFYCDGISIGYLENEPGIKTVAINRVNKWRVFLRNELWGEIERPAIVGRKNLIIKRIAPFAAPLTITLNREYNIKEFLLVLLFPLRIIFKNNNDLVLPSETGEKLDISSQKLLFSICIFMRTLVFQFGFDWS